MNEPKLELLDALRGDRTAPPPDEARARVASRLGLGGPAVAASARGGAPSAPTSAPGKGRIAAMVGSAFVAGGAVGALLHAALATTPAPVVYIHRAAASVSAPALAPAATLAPVPDPVDSAPPPVSAPIPAVNPTPAPRPGITQLDAERALLDAARVSLVSGDTDAALAALDRHARTYGHPILGEERDALYVQTLVRAGRYDDARARAEAFRRKNPQSLLLSAVDAAIASIP